MINLKFCQENDFKDFFLKYLVRYIRNDNDGKRIDLYRIGNDTYIYIYIYMGNINHYLTILLVSLFQS